MAGLLDQHLLTVLIFLPTAGAVLLCFFPKTQPRMAMWGAFVVSVAELALSVPLWTRFAVGGAGFQFWNGRTGSRRSASPIRSRSTGSRSCSSS